MDFGLPFHSCTFDDIMMVSSGVRGNPIFFDNSLFLKKNGTTHQIQTLQAA